MRPRLRILYVAYPLLPVRDSSAGGAEQMLGTLERAMHLRGHSTAVAACAGSEVAGELISTGAVPTITDALEQREREHHQCILKVIEQRQAAGTPFDLIHDQGGLFWKAGAEIDVPILLTLHLPRDFYGAALNVLPANVFLNCVSHDQQKRFGEQPRMLGVIQNGIELSRFQMKREKNDYLLWMGRICPEKGTHIAIEVARRAQMPLAIAGQVYPFSWHQQYFEQQIKPALSEQVRFYDSPDLVLKDALLRGARALLAPSLVDETSSLVSMEAAACGTPVVAFRRGALSEVVQHGKTGFMVDDAEAMRAALLRLGNIDAKRCRAHAEHNYSADRMADDYERCYAAVIARWQERLSEARAA